ncbi:MAG: PhoPQ-activated pathogenicity-related family protein [Isosphaeraceae bacterium]
MIPFGPWKISLSPVACLSSLIVLSFAFTSSGAELDDYVQAPDPAFTWKQTSNHTTPAGMIHSIDLTSQVWQGITWKHALTIYEPAELTCKDTVLLFIVGGSTDSRPDDGDHKLAFALTKTTGARVAVLHQVPNQPLLGNRKEDDLISETFVRYLETKDKKWPLLFPMVKSAVRAMDAVQAWAKERGKGEVRRFVVTGGSKRGWTTWLTGAVDQRVIAIAPMVIVMLNLGLQGPNQLEVWGNYSEQIDDYVKRGLMERAQTRAGMELWKMVDPYTFRERLTKPKLLINGANDRYWTLNAIDLYWNGLKGPKYVVELPNAGHGLEVNRDWALNGLGAFFRYQVTGRPMPVVSWTVDSAASTEAKLTIHADPAPRSARLWTATAATRDFRDSKWSASPLKAGTTLTATLTKPDSGHGAAFADLEYEIDGIPYHLTTTFFEPGVKPTKPLPVGP